MLSASRFSQCLSQTRLPFAREREILLDELCASQEKSPVTAPLSLLQIQTDEDYVVWARVGNLSGTAPPALRGVAGVLDPPRARALLFGGCFETVRAHGKCSADLIAHHIDASAWVAIDVLASTAKPSAREGASATQVGDSIYYFGGDAEGALSNELFQLTPATLAWHRPFLTGARPPPRHEHAAAALSGRLWLFGGGSDGGYYDDLWVFDPPNARWSQPWARGAAPSGRKGHGLVAVGTNLYLWGGCAATCADVAVYSFDTLSMRWERRNGTTGAPPVPREGHVTAVVHGRLMILGGCDGKRGAHARSYALRGTQPS